MTAGAAGRAPGGTFAPPSDTGEALGLAAVAPHPHRRLRADPLRRPVRAGQPSPDAPWSTCPPSPATSSIRPVRGGDLCVQACADDAQVAFHAIHNLTRLALGSATLRYLQIGFGRDGFTPGPAGRRHATCSGSRTGPTTSVPTDDAADAHRFVWVDGGPTSPGCIGGSYLVARRIRIHLEAWDRSTLGDQEQTIGRFKDSGAPLGAHDENDAVDLNAVDSAGAADDPRRCPHPGGGAVDQRRGRHPAPRLQLRRRHRSRRPASSTPDSSSSASRRTRADQFVPIQLGSRRPGRPGRVPRAHRQRHLRLPSGHRRRRTDLWATDGLSLCTLTLPRHPRTPPRVRPPAITRHRTPTMPPAKRGHCLEKSRRRPTLPGGYPPSTIGAGGLNCRVRNGNGCLSAAMATGNCALSGARGRHPQGRRPSPA